MRTLAVIWVIAFYYFLYSLVTAFGATVTLTWDESAGPDVVGYRVKWGFQEGGPYPHPVEAGMSLTVTIVEPWPLDETIYFTAYSYNTLGIESLPSNEVAWRVPLPTPTPTPTPTPIPPPPTPQPTPAPPTNLQLWFESLVNWWRNLFST